MSGKRTHLVLGLADEEPDSELRAVADLLNNGIDGLPAPLLEERLRVGHREVDGPLYLLAGPDSTGLGLGGRLGGTEILLAGGLTSVLRG